MLLKIEKLFFRYFIRFFFISLLAFTGIFFIFSFIQTISKKGIMQGISLYYLARMLFYLIPSILETSIPFSFIFSIFFSVGELSARGEIIAIRVGGFSYRDISRLFFIFSFFLFIFFSILNNSISPVYSLKSRESLRTMTNRITNINIKPNSFDSISSFTIYASSITDNEMNNVILYRDMDNNNSLKSFVKISAQKGYFEILKEQGIKINLIDGRISAIDRNNYSIYNAGMFKEYMTFIPFEVNEKTYSIPPKYLRTNDILNQIKHIGDRDQIFGMREELVSRFTTDLSILILALLSLAFAFYYEKESKYFSFIISVGIIIFYYLGDILCSLMIRKNHSLFPYINFLPLIIMSLCFFYIWFGKLEHK